MNANVSKNSLRLALAVTALFGGVVFESANVGSATGGVPLPPKKPELIQVSLVTGADADKNSTTYKPGTLTDDVRPAPAASPAYKLLYDTIRDELRQGRPTYALRLLESDPMAKKLRHAEYDRLQAAIAQSYYIEGKLEKARGLAEKAVARSGQKAPLAAWVGGMASWRLKDYKSAGRHFGIVAESQESSGWLQSAGAFWASRAAMRSGQFRQADQWLHIAADHPRTFYGLIALRALDRDYDFNWAEPAAGRSQVTRLKNDKAVAQAFRLAREGSFNHALRELNRTSWMRDRAGREQLLAYALKNKQVAIAMHLARLTPDDRGNFYDAALYPDMPWQPESGYQVDKALIYALIRQESRFNPHARSVTGATGLMQLMPATARYISNGQEMSLTNPEVNIAVGQKYIRYLLNDASVNNDLFRMMVAYNAGPGNLARWKANLKDVDDPLVFIESIPSAETRAFVERVMVNYWIYRIRMGQETPSLDAIATGDQGEYAKAGEQHTALLLASN